MFCSNCGKEIEEGAVFCKHCGAKIDDNARLGSAKNALSGSGYTSQNGNAPSTASGGKKPGKVPLAALLILSIAVAACAGFFGYRAAHKENADVQEAEKENAGAEELQPNAEEEGQADIDAEEQTDRKAELTAALESISYYGDKSKCSMTAEQAAAYGQLIADGLAGDFSFRGGYDESCFTITSWNSPFQIFDSDMGEQVEADRFHAMLCDFSGDGVPYLYVYSSTNDTGEQSFEIYGWTGQKAELIFDTDAEKSYRNNFYIYEDENNKYEIRMDYEEYCPPALFYRVQTYAFAEGTIKIICERTEENNFEDELWHVIENGVETVYTSEEYSTLTAGRSQTENHKHTLPYTCFHAMQPSTLQEMMEGLNRYAALWGGESTEQGDVQPANDNSSAENADLAGLLTNISWEDINSGNYDTTRLHFSFDDSTDQAVELDYPSAVEKIEYMDITGDGIEEALVYRYFANTATEYTLIDFFKIEPGMAINISPSVYIKELSNEVWDMELLNEYAKGYTSPTLKVTSYGKEDGVAFEQAVYLLGYKDGSWNVIQE